MSISRVKQIRIFEKASFWSNAAFLIPFILAIFLQQTGMIVILFGVIFFSSTYHLVKPNDNIDWWWTKGRTRKHTLLLWMDTVFANLLVLLNSILFVRSGFTPYFYGAMILVIPALVLFFRSKTHHDTKHAIWHIISSLITTLALLS